MDSSPTARPTRDLRKNIQKTTEMEENQKGTGAKTRGVGKKAPDQQTRSPAGKRERPVETDIDAFFEDVANTFENRGPAPNTAPGLVPVDQIGVVPIRDNGKRMLRYMYNDLTRWVELPIPKYGTSLGDILPPEIQREPWMELVRHPLTWDGIERPWLTVGPTQMIFEHIPKRVTPNWRTSVESVGMHWFKDYPKTERPPYQMSLLFRVAILGSPHQTLGSYDIVEILMAKFPWYNDNRYRERTSTSAVQRSRDLNAYWVDQISNMSSKSTNRTWLDRHPFLARITRGAKGHFWRLKDIPVYRIPRGRLPIYAVLSLPPGTVIGPPTTVPLPRQIPEEERPKIWDRNSYTPSVTEDVEMVPAEDMQNQPASFSPRLITYEVVEQNSSGEEELPDEEDEILQPVYEPVYTRYAGMLPARVPIPPAFEMASNPNHMTKEPMSFKVDLPSEPPVPKPVQAPDLSAAHQVNGDARSRKEDALMELVEFALEMDTRRPIGRQGHLIRSSSDGHINTAAAGANKRSLRRMRSQS